MKLPRKLLEVCVENAAGARAAVGGGAHRLELCVDLAEDGLTPPVELTRQVVLETPVPVMVMIRPRPGDFAYQVAELEQMVRSIDEARDTGAAGVVFGALTPDGDIDQSITGALLERSGDLDVTFHRAFDQVRDLGAALEVLVNLGIGRVLTSAGKPTITEGLAPLTELAAIAGDRITIMPGGGLSTSNLPWLLQRGFREIHGSASEFTEGHRQTSVSKVQELVRLLPDKS